MSEPAAARPRGVARLLAALVRFYQLGISPLLRPSCRFAPSCSEYAYESLCEHGALRGSWLSLRRLLRCHPLCAGGYDPVPPSKRRGGGRARVAGQFPDRPSARTTDLVSVAPVAASATQEAGESPC